MIKSILDNDLYKFTMQQVIFHNFPNVQVEYTLQIRNKKNLNEYFKDIEKEISELEYLNLHPQEIKYLQSIRFLSADYIEYLSKFKFNPSKHIYLKKGKDNLELTIKGNWLDTILYEVPLLAIISECYGTAQSEFYPLGKCMENLYNKARYIRTVCPEIKFADFGTRRRYSFFNHENVISYFKDNLQDQFFGTSNLYFAMKYKLKPIGTMAHELLMAAQVLFPLYSHQKDMLYIWAKEFQGDLGIALPDTLGLDYFLKDFSLDLAKLFDGIRHDSGDPIKFGNKIIEYYKQLNIDPLTKTIVFSDSLDIKKAIELQAIFKDKIKTSFGIGTHLTNDVGVEPLSIVIKLTECNGLPVAKISDSLGKELCKNLNYLAFLKDLIK